MHNNAITTDSQYSIFPLLLNLWHVGQYGSWFFASGLCQSSSQSPKVYRRPKLRHHRTIFSPIFHELNHLRPFPASTIIDLSCCRFASKSFNFFCSPGHLLYTGFLFSFSNNLAADSCLSNTLLTLSWRKYSTSSRMPTVYYTFYSNSQYITWRQHITYTQCHQFH